ncbi:MAG: transcriptional repressor NrdR [Nitrospirae bacterium]|nr:transcriptional repressor NrdR [Candidatus Manganitrophaceae bacterium]
MQCPFCSHVEDKVVDSRLSKEGEVIRRRRECLHCQRRFTTYERVEEIFPMVIKKDGRREPFDRQKIFAGLKKACEKRPVSIDLLESVVTRIEKKIQERGESEIESRIVGEEVMRQLHGIDQVAYVRFASVYREFKDVGQFLSELKNLLNEQGQEKQGVAEGNKG